MKKIFTLLLFCINLVNLYSQISINTSNPQQIFHIDGKSSEETTNPITGVPNIIQQSDDVVITNKGQLGIGTTSPITKLDIINNDNTDISIKIVDGTQKAGRVLTSDADGVGTWKDIGFKIITGYIPDDYYTFGVTEDKYLGAYITLPQGKWFVYIGTLVGGYFEQNSRFAARYSLFSSDIVQEEKGFKFIGVNRYVLNQITTGFEDFKSFLFASGVVRVEVTDPSVTLYLWDVNTKKYGEVTDRYGNTNQIGPNGENYIFAVKQYN